MRKVLLAVPHRDALAALRRADGILVHVEDDADVVLLAEGEKGVQTRDEIGVERRRRGRLPARPDDAEADDRGAPVLAGRRPGLALEHRHVVLVEGAAGRAARGAALERAGRAAAHRRDPGRALCPAPLTRRSFLAVSQISRERAQNGQDCG